MKSVLGLQLVYLTILHFVTNGLASETTKTSIKWSVENIPNPMKDSIACGRPNSVLHSAICDPDHLLPVDGTDAIENIINNSSSKIVEYGILIVQSMNLASFQNDVDLAAKGFAMKVHDKWGVGDKSLQNGVLILLSVSDRAVFISTGSGVKQKLSDYNLDKIINRMKPHLRQKNYVEAIASAILDVNDLLSGTVRHIRPEMYEKDDNTGIILFLTFMVLFIGYGSYKSYRNGRQLHELNRGRASLQSVIKDVNSARHRVYMSSSCPMCLEDFSSEETIAAGVTTESLVIPKTIPCGHVFCDKCIRQYLSVSNNLNCPVCRERIAHVDGDQPPGEFVPSDPTLLIPYRLHMQSTTFRINRIRSLYPSSIDASTQSLLNSAMHRGSLSDAIDVVERRSVEISTLITQMKQTSSSSSRHTSSSRSSFGGGSSSGGRGGRW